MAMGTLTVIFASCIFNDQNDRFIPARSAMDFDYCHYMMTALTIDNNLAALNGTDDSSRTTSHNELLAINILHGSALYTQPRPLLSIRTSTIRASQPLDVCGLHPFRLPAPVSLPLQSTRTKNKFSSPPHVSSTPVCTIDAPGLRDDYYLNLMDWGPNNVIAIALENVVYLYNPTTCKIQECNACTEPTDYVTSVAWVGNPYNKFLAVGTLFAELQIWDVETLTKLHSIRSHRARISSLSWSNKGTLATGSRDSTIHLNDVRCTQQLLGKLAHHREEVCGLAWSPDGSILASGGSDKRLCLWDHALTRADRLNNSSCPRSAHFEHTAAVRALAWSPCERNILASGGGTADSTIKLWNTSNGQMLRSVDAGSQVCELVWSTTTRELVSAHGHCSTSNQLTLWRYPRMKRVRELTGHTARVLHLAISPNGSSVVSAGADETLRFWNVFQASESPCASRIDRFGERFSLSTAVIR